MDLRNGRTIRRCRHHISQDVLLSANRNGHLKENTCLYGFEFQAGVMYTTKKKGRWKLSSHMHKDVYEGDHPIMYSRHQCIEDTKPLLDLYFYDSISQSEFGSLHISNKRLNGGSFNGRSIVAQIENRHNYTDKERRMFEKLRNGKGKRNFHSSSALRNMEDFNDFSVREEHERESRERGNCIVVKEYVHVNDMRTVSKLSTTLSKRRDTRKRGPILTKSYWKDDDYSNDEDDSMQEYEFENDDTLEFLELDKENCFDSLGDNEPRKIFSLKINCDKDRVPRKRRIKKHIGLNNPFIDDNKTSECADSIVGCDTTVIDLQEDMFPYVSIQTPVTEFLDDVIWLTKSLSCRSSVSNPPTILVDLDDYAETKTKSFLLLKTNLKSGDKDVTVKVIFNMDSCGMDLSEILAQQYHNLSSLVEAVRSRMKEGTARYSPNRKMIMLDGKLDGMTNCWKTKISDFNEPLYFRHNEWSNRELNMETLSRMLSYTPRNSGECVVCFNVIHDWEIVTMEPCEHMVCEGCLSSHVIYLLETGMRKMVCPGIGCDVMLDISLILSSVHWERYTKRLEVLESSIIDNGGCPCFHCGAVLLHHEDHLNERRKLIEYRCACGNNICNNCGQREHFPSTCNEMRRHTVQMATLKDLILLPTKIKPLIYRGRSCPKCFKFVIKDGGCNHMSCHCGAHFCWGCGDMMGDGRHAMGTFPCSRIQSLMKQDLTSYSTIPDPGALRSKLYCMALNQYVSNNNYDAQLFYKRLQSVLRFGHASQEIEQMSAQVSKLSVLIEAIFVKASQKDRRRQAATLRYLRGSATMFLFYQARIRHLVEQGHSDALRFRARACGMAVLREHCRQLEELIAETSGLVCRFGCRP